jgi:hypothetical protein
MEGSSTSDGFLTFGDFVSDFTFSLLSSNGISSFVSTCTSPSGVGTVSIRKAGFQNPEILDEKLYPQEEGNDKIDGNRKISSIIVKALKTF